MRVAISGSLYWEEQVKYMLANLLLAIMPVSRWFEFKRIMLKVLGISVGDGARVCSHVRFYGAGKVTIGQAVWVGPGTEFHSAIGGNITIGDRCDIAPGVMFVTGSHDMGDEHRRAGPGTAASIAIGAGSWIGTRATILGGSQIESGCMVAAGSLVLPKVWAANTLLMGTPARATRKLDDMQ
jgi:maltose O-acetyltransferase